MGSLKCTFINNTCKVVSGLLFIEIAMRLLLLCLALPLVVLGAPDPQYRQRLGNQGQGGRGGVRNRGRGGGARGYGRRRPPPVVEYDDGTNYEDSYESYNYSGENRRYGGGRGGEFDYNRQPSTTERARYQEERRISTTESTTEADVKQESEEEGCGSECRNLVHELDHRKEDTGCPYEGMVMDIYGYCRYVFDQERRDWAWWESLRNYIYYGNSWANSYSPNVDQQTYHSG